MLPMDLGWLDFNELPIGSWSITKIGQIGKFLYAASLSDHAYVLGLMTRVNPD